MKSLLYTILLGTISIACTAKESDSGEMLRQVDPTTSGDNGVVSRAINIPSQTPDLTLSGQIWYPSQKSSEDVHRYGDIKEGTAANSGVVDCSVQRPVVVFSHGNTGMRYQSYFLAEFLTSHGYLVLAPDHAGNTIFDNDESRKPELILRRPQDLSDTYDWLLSQSEFNDCVDPDAGFAVIGHSFGGYTTHAITGGVLDTERTLEHCADYGGWLCDHVQTIADTEGTGVYDHTDDRIWGAVSMTPAALESLLGGIEDISVPTLVLGGEYDTLTPVEPLVQTIFDMIGTERKHFAIVQKAGHYTFSNACDFLNTYEDCGEDFLSPTEAHALINTLTLAFLEDLQGTPNMDVHLPPADDRIEWQ